MYINRCNVQKPHTLFMFHATDRIRCECSQHNIKRLLFVTEMHHIFCELITDFFRRFRMRCVQRLLASPSLSVRPSARIIPAVTGRIGRKQVCILQTAVRDVFLAGRQRRETQCLVPKTTLDSRMLLAQQYKRIVALSRWLREDPRWHVRRNAIPV